MHLALRLVALTFVSLFGMAVWLVVGSYVVPTFTFAAAPEVNLNWVLSASAGPVAAAALVSPFLVVLFTRRRWLAALFMTAPLLILHGSSTLSAGGAYLAVLYYVLLLGGACLTSRVLNSG